MENGNFDDFKINEIDINFVERMLKSLPSNIYFKDMEGKYVFCTHYWNHSNSEYYSGVDIPIYLDSTPQETLQSRLERNRDQWIDNPFTMMVLDIEQKMLKKQSEKAKLIVTRDGTVLDRKEYAQFVPKLQK